MQGSVLKAPRLADSWTREKHFKELENKAQKGEALKFLNPQGGRGSGRLWSELQGGPQPTVPVQSPCNCASFSLCFFLKEGASEP